MSWYGDPDDLDRLADRLAAAAIRVSERAAEVRAASSSAHWHGPAADAFHASVYREGALLDRASAELDDAAAALHRHADAVREEIARLRALPQAAERLLSTGWSRLADLVP